MFLNLKNINETDVKHYEIKSIAYIIAIIKSITDIVRFTST